MSSAARLNVLKDHLSITATQSDRSQPDSDLLIAKNTSLRQSFPNTWYRTKRMCDAKLGFVTKKIVSWCAFTAT